MPTVQDFFDKAHKGAKTEAEQEVARCIVEIVESGTSADAKAIFSEIRIVKALEVDVAETGKKALVIVVPYNVHRYQVKPNQERVIAELEKKSKRHVVLTAQREMIQKNRKKAGFRIRPRSRTLTAVHEALVDDIVAPSEIVGKRTRVQSNGKVTQKFLLSSTAKESIEEKLTTFSAVYKALTCKEGIFEYPEYTLSC